MKNLSKKELALISYGYALRMADEIIEDDKKLLKCLSDNNLHQVYREMLAKTIIEDSLNKGGSK
jgi:hypothetical protein